MLVLLVGTLGAGSASDSCVNGSVCNDACSNGLCVGTPIGGCNPAAVPTMTDWGRIALVVLLALTALVAGAPWQRSPNA